MPFDSITYRRETHEPLTQDVEHLLQEAESRVARDVLWRELGLTPIAAHTTEHGVRRQVVRQPAEVLQQATEELFHGWMQDIREELGQNSGHEAVEKALEAYSTMLFHVAQKPYRALPLSQAETQDTWDTSLTESLDTRIEKYVALFRAMLRRDSVWVRMLSQQALHQQTSWVEQAWNTGALAIVNTVHGITRTRIMSDTYPVIPFASDVVVDRGRLMLAHRNGESLKRQQVLREKNAELSGAYEDGEQVRRQYEQEVTEQANEQVGGLHALYTQLKNTPIASISALEWVSPDILSLVQDYAERVKQATLRLNQAKSLTLKPEEKVRIEALHVRAERDLQILDEKLKAAIVARDILGSLAEQGIYPRMVFEREAALSPAVFLWRARELCREALNAV